MPLTRRQKQIVDYLGDYIKRNGYAPSFEEIAEHFEFQSLATVHEHLTNLERKGYIRRSHNESRSIEIVPPRGQAGATDLPLLGLVAAGEPIEAVTSGETLAVPNDLIPRRGPSYVLRVRGESMIDDHIEDGDLVVIHPQGTASNGQRVVAMIDGEVTLKKFYKEKDHIRLEPANGSMAPIIVDPSRDAKVIGVLVGVLRKC